MIGVNRRRVMGGRAPQPSYDEKSYIQDGLVFQLDGINKGSNQGYWTDLKGNVTFTIPTSEYLTEETNGFTWTGNVNMAEGSGTIPSGTAYTIEIAMFNTRDKNSGSKWGCFSSSNNSNAGSISIGQFNDMFVFINRTSSIAYSSAVFRGFSTNSANADTVCINKNEVSIRSSTSSDYITGKDAGVGNTYVFGGMRGTIYAIRIYNRKLTLAEMQFNQNIDLKRFGT